MIGAVNPFDAPAVWDVMVIGGISTPGLCRLKDPERESAFDKKKGKGADGGTTTFQGKILAEFTVRFEAWIADHFSAWDAIVPKLSYDPAKGRPVQAVDVYHPALADLDISSCVVQKLGGWVDEGEGLFARDIKFLEYRPPTKTSAVSTPTQSGEASDPDAVKPDPQREALQKQFGATMAATIDAYTLIGISKPF